jgi:tetratricopeptide (TPR) repeat protein
MVVRNEADFLSRSLESIVSIAQELVVVDTGSSDDTIAIAKRFNARVFGFQWRNDFSAARNFSLSVAISPWILVLDADEVLSSRHHKNLKELVRSSDNVAYSLIQRNYVAESGKLTWDQKWKPNGNEYKEGDGYTGYLDVPVVRLFPRNPAIGYHGCVHERVEDSIAKLGFDIRASGLVLHHYGQVRSPERMRQKKQVYLELGLQKLQEDPSARAHFELGIQYQELGNFQQAISHFLEARHSSEFRIADFYLGICYSKVGKLEQARLHLSRVQYCELLSVEILCELGLLNIKDGRTEEAIKVFRQALVENQEHVAALCYLGSLLANQGQIREGIELLERATCIDSNHFDSWINLGLAYQKSNLPSPALESLERAYSLKPGNPDIARHLAKSYVHAGRDLDASRLLSEAIARNPDDEQLRMYWAAFLSMSGQEQQMREVYRSILKKGGRFARLAQRQMEEIETAEGDRQRSRDSNRKGKEHA